MDPVRRHLLFLLEGLVAERLQSLRSRWDPVMASRTPPHVSLVYPEETTDESLLVKRAALAAPETEAFVISLGRLVAEEEGRGGVWFTVLDPSDTWNRLRFEDPSPTVPPDPDRASRHRGSSPNLPARPGSLHRAGWGSHRG